jgi:membrane protein required for colicin V production
MNYLDLIIIVPIIFGIYKGYKSGLIISLFTLLALLVGIYMAFKFSNELSCHFYKNLKDQPQFVPIVSFLVIFLVVGAAIYFGGRALESLVKIAKLSLINKILGASLGALKYTFIMISVLFILVSFDKEEKLITSQVKHKSILFYSFINFGKLVFPSFNKDRLTQIMDAQEWSKEEEMSIDEIIETQKTADSLGIDIYNKQQIKKLHEKNK